MKASIVIPSYNHGRYIERAIESVLSQDWPSLELVVVDDGSRDETRRILCQINDPRIKVYFQSNMGAHAALNRGISLATGDYIGILNSDDQYAAGRISALIGEMSRTRTRAASSWIELIDENGHQVGIKHGFHDLLPSWVLPGSGCDGTAESELWFSNYIATTSNLLATRDVFRQVGPFRPFRFVHDWDFFFRLSRLTRVLLVEGAYVRYRVHSSNTIASNDEEMFLEIALCLAAAAQHELGTRSVGNDPKSLIEDAVGVAAPPGISRLLFGLTLAILRRGGAVAEGHFVDELLANDRAGLLSLAGHLSRNPRE